MESTIATIVSTQEAYIDEFNPRDYLNTYYKPGTGILFGEWTEFALQNLCETFTKGGVKGDTLLDVGTGPSIYHLLSACEVFDKIIVSDLVEQCRAEFQKWLKKDPDAFDWTHVIKRACELEGNGEDYEKKAEKLRSKVKEVLKCDVLKANPFDPVVVPPVDCLLSSVCLETPCKNIESYCNVLKNFKALIKPGGHLVVLSLLHASFYFAGKKQFTGMYSKKEELEMAFKEAGYQIERAVYTTRTDKSMGHIADYGGHYFIHARTPNQ